MGLRLDHSCAPTVRRKDRPDKVMNNKHKTNGLQPNGDGLQPNCIKHILQYYMRSATKVFATIQMLILLVHAS